jgi:hypothetical protein
MGLNLLKIIIIDTLTKNRIAVCDPVGCTAHLHRVILLVCVCALVQCPACHPAVEITTGAAEPATGIDRAGESQPPAAMCPAALRIKGGCSWLEQRFATLSPLAVH